MDFLGPMAMNGGAGKFKMSWTLHPDARGNRDSQVGFDLGGWTVSAFGSISNVDFSSGLSLLSQVSLNNASFGRPDTKLFLYIGTSENISSILTPLTLFINNDTFSFSAANMTFNTGSPNHIRATWEREYRILNGRTTYNCEVTE